MNHQTFPPPHPPCHGFGQNHQLVSSDRMCMSCVTSDVFFQTAVTNSVLPDTFTAFCFFSSFFRNVPGDGEKLYSNKGVNFEDNWHERVLER